MPATQEEYCQVTPSETSLERQPPAYHSGTTIITCPLLPQWKANQETGMDQGLCYGLRTLL